VTKAKRRLVVWDDDNYRGSALRPQDLRLPEDVEVVNLNTTRITADLMPQLFTQARAVVDLFVPGAERGLYEGVLRGALPIISGGLNGGDVMDFPLPPGFRVDPANASDVRAAVMRVLDGYDELNAAFEPMAQMTRALPHAFLSAVDGIFASATVEVVAEACDPSRETMAFPLILSVIRSLPLARVIVYVRDAPAFLARHSSAVEVLLRHGLTDVGGGADHHSIRFRNCGDQLESGAAARVMLDVGALVLSPNFVYEAVEAAMGARGLACVEYDGGSVAYVLWEDAEWSQVALRSCARVETRDVIGQLRMKEVGSGVAGLRLASLVEDLSEWMAWRRMEGLLGGEGHTDRICDAG
jgi:hypothetical protein